MATFEKKNFFLGDPFSKKNSKALETSSRYHAKDVPKLSFSLSAEVENLCLKIPEMEVPVLTPIRFPFIRTGFVTFIVCIRTQKIFIDKCDNLSAAISLFAATVSLCRPTERHVLVFAVRLAGGEASAPQRAREEATGPHKRQFLWASGYRALPARRKGRRK